MGTDSDSAIIPAREQPRGVTLFGSDTPAAVVGQASLVADALRDVLRKQKLTLKIGGKEHILIDGWALAGTLCGVFPVTRWVRPLTEEIDGKKEFLGWEARVEAVTKAGEIVGAAESECRWSEKLWSTRDSYALRSMAQTRAASKALRMPLGFIATLAGYAATPAEEMPMDAQTPEGAAREFGDAFDEANPPPKKPKGTKKLLDALLLSMDKAKTIEDVKACWSEAAKYVWTDDEFTRLVDRKEMRKSDFAAAAPQRAAE
jgi:hypothetical protein